MASTARSVAVEVIGVRRSGPERDVEVLAGALPLPGLVGTAEEVRILAVGVGVDRDVAHVAAAPEDLLRAVAVVVVDVQDRDPLAGRLGDGMRRDRGVVEEAVPAVHRPRRMMTGGPAQAIRSRLAAEDEVDRGQCHVHGRARGGVRARNQRGRRIEAPESGPPADVARLSDEALDRLVAHPLEHRPVRIRVGRQERARDVLGSHLGPGFLEEAHAGPGRGPR